MSWLLGRNRPQQPQDVPPSDGGNPDGATAGERSGDAQLSKAERKAMEAYRFDSSALERAAEAAKTLERSSKLFHHPILIGVIINLIFGRGGGCMYGVHTQLHNHLCVYMCILFDLGSNRKLLKS